MSIIYPSPAGGTTVVSERSQYAIPATVDATFPIVISGSTSPSQIATLFIPPTFLYQMSGSYNVVAVGYITGSSGITGSLEIQGMDTYNAFLIKYSPFGMGDSVMGIRFSGSTEYLSLNYPLNLPGADYGVSIPINFSGSISDYTASIYGIYFSPTS